MKTNTLVLSGLVCLLLALNISVSAQVSFFQPPTYPGCLASGALFVADFNGDGKPDLLCSSGVLGLGNGDGTFKVGTPVPGGALAVADFNGDGKPDLLEGGINTLSVLLGNGDGTFQSPINTATTGTLPFWLAAADLNGDGRADLVGISSGALYVFISNGDGTFKPGIAYSLGTSQPGGLSIADFNGDGKNDVVVNTYGQELVFLGNGDGTLQAPKASAGVPYGSSSVVGDFNGDGKLDLAVGGICPPCTMYVLRGNGDGTFQTPTAAFSGGGWFAAADVNGDGKLDLVSAAGPVVQIYLGNGDGTFSEPRSYVSNFPAGDADGRVVIADFNLDGKLDIASSGGILLGNGDGTFQAIPLTTLSLPPISVAVGDFERNGKPDVAVGSAAQSGSQASYLYILHNSGSGTLSLLHTYYLPEPGFQILVGDLNGDGNLDLVVIGTPQGGYSVLLGNGDGSFQSPVLYYQDVYFQFATLIDVNNDKTLDLVEAATDPRVGVSLGNGDGTFAPTVTYNAMSLYNPTLITGDFNGDGKVDIGVPHADLYLSPDGTAMLYGNGDGTFQPAIIPADLNSFTASATADFRNIGRADLFSGNQVALNNGDGTFTFLPILNYGGLAVADINGDGKVDLLIPNALPPGQSGCQTAVTLGNGDGTFGSVMNVPPSGCYPFSPISGTHYLFIPPNPIVDMNGDGRPDIVFLWGPGVGVLLNTTPPGFSLSATALSPGTVIVGSSATSEVSVAPTFGFTGTVTLSCTGLPSGASCAFNPASIAKSSGTSALTIMTSASVVADTYAVQVQGTSGSIVNSVLGSLVVQAAPDFSVGAASGSPTSQTISAGQTASFSLAFAPTGSFAGTINLSCAITPAVTPAPTCSLSSASVQISGSETQTVTVKVGTTAPVTGVAAPHVNFPSGPKLLLWTFMFLGSTGLWMRNRKRLRVLAAPIVVLAFAFSVGCGGSSSSSAHTTPGTPAGSYMSTIMASSGGLNHGMTLTVVVQ